METCAAASVGARRRRCTQLIRGGASDTELALAIGQALGEKPDDHRFTKAAAASKLLPMMGIGG